MEAYSRDGRSGSGAIAAIAVRASRPGDLAAVRALLSDAGLPLDGLEAAFEHGIVAVGGGAAVVGAAAVEPYGPNGLLRSVVVDPAIRGTGLGRALVEAAEGVARDLGVRDLYLLTETAPGWFARLGYAPLPRSAAPAAVAASVEFTVSCVDTGVLMHRHLGGTGRPA